MKQFTSLRRAALLLLTTLLTATTAWADTETVSYIDADGNEQTVTATVLTGDASADGLSTNDFGNILIPAGWYVVKNSKDGVDASYTVQLKYTGDPGTVHLILADGAEMTVNKSNNTAIYLDQGYPLAIYGQSGGTGRLTVTGYSKAIDANGDMTVNGGIVNVTATGTGSSAHAIYVWNGLTINGGQVTATTAGSGKGIYVDGAALTIGCRKASDFVSFNSYEGTVNIKSGQTLYAGATAYSGNNVSLPSNETVTLRTFSSDYISVSGDEYTIKNAAGWNLFCDFLQDNDSWNRFSGKTVKLDADITVTRMAGSQYHDFCGTFDGGGHTLTVTLSGSSDRMAPFSYISNVGSAPAAIRNLNVVADITSSGQNASALVGEAWGELTIEQCTVSGTVAVSNQFAGGIIGSASNTPLNISNCISSVTISSSKSGDGTHGGFAGRVPSSATLNISGCVFDGKIITTSGTTNCGGFVGHSENTAGSNVTITNCLYAPTADDQTVSEGCETFCRNIADGHITNCYYTRALGTAQGKATRTVAAAADVTIEAVALTGTATPYTVSGITAYSGGGLQRGQTLYYGSGDAVSLTLSHADRDGFTFSAYTATNGGTLTGSDNPYLLEMPDADVTIGATYTKTPVITSYVDADGTLHDNIEAIPLDETMTSLAAGWYVVNSDISYTLNVYLKGDVHLILADGCHMNFGTNYKAFSGVSYALTIYGQSAGNGALSIYTMRPIDYGIYVKNLTINGGHITANTTGNGAHALCAWNGDVTINGGTVNATATGSKADAIFAAGNFNYNGGNVTTSATSGLAIEAKSGNYFNWRSSADHITIGATGLYDGSVRPMFNGMMTDGLGHIYDNTTIYTSNDLYSASIANLNNLAASNNGLTLYPYVKDLVLDARQAPDQNYWTTFYCGHTDYVIGDNACAYAATYDDTKAQLTLHRLGNVVPKNCAVIIVADNDVVIMTDVNPASPSGQANFAAAVAAVTAADPDAITGNALRGLNIETPTADILKDLGNGTLYVLGQTIVDGEKHFGFHHYTATEMPARKAFVLVPAAPGSNANALTRGISIEFGDDATGIEAVEVLGNPSNQGRANDDSWYTLDGRRLSAKPTKKGLYIYKGKKQVVK